MSEKENIQENSVKVLAEKYLSAQEQETDERELKEAKNHLSELQERYEEFKQDYGESDPATEELGERASEAEERVEELKRAQQIPEEFERELIEQATEFMLSEEWLDSEVIEALNQALVGECDSTLIIEEVEISGPEDVENLDDIVRFDIIDIVRKLAMDKLDESDALEEEWNSIKGTTKESPFRVVATQGSANPDDVLEEIDDDDVDREVVRGRLKNTVKRDINPYYRQDGVYHLATTGKYLAKEYAETPTHSDEGSVESVDEDDDGQITLDNTVGSAGGDSDD